VTPEVERARDQSRVFLFAAGRCNEFLSLPSGRQRFLLVPSLVLYAFAAEVGLKAVALHTTGTTKRDHDLQALFHALPDDVQARIRADASTTYPGSEASFDQDLAMVARTFEVWRYLHERHSVDTDLGFLQRLGHAVDAALTALS